MYEDRSAAITLDGVEYKLVFSAGAAKEMARKYGGIGKLGELLSDADNYAGILENLNWMLTLLINQGIRVHNFYNNGARKELLSEDTVEALTSPFETAAYIAAISKALGLGTLRNIESGEPERKNPVTG